MAIVPSVKKLYPNLRNHHTHLKVTQLVENFNLEIKEQIKVIKKLTSVTTTTSTPTGTTTSISSRTTTGPSANITCTSPRYTIPRHSFTRNDTRITGNIQISITRARLPRPIHHIRITPRIGVVIPALWWNLPSFGFSPLHCLFVGAVELFLFSTATRGVHGGEHGGGLDVFYGVV